MLRWILNAIKWWAIWLATGQLVSAYSKDKTFKTKIKQAKGFEKLKVAGEYLVSTNKKLIQETDFHKVVEWVKETAHQSQKQLQSINPWEVVETIKSQAKQQWNSIVVMLTEKISMIEEELEIFEMNAKEYAEDMWTEYYRQLASKFALFKKSVSKYILEGALAADEQFDLEHKIKILSGKLEALKRGK